MRSPVILWYHGERKHNRPQGLRRIQRPEPSLSTQPASLITFQQSVCVAIAIRRNNIGSTGVSVMKEDRKRHHDGANDHVWNANIQVRICKLRSWVESFGVFEDPEDDLSNLLANDTQLSCLIKPKQTFSIKVNIRTSLNASNLAKGLCCARWVLSAK